MSTSLGWWLLFLAAVLLIVCGFQGSLGRMVAVVFAPGRLNVNDQ